MHGSRLHLGNHNPFTISARWKRNSPITSVRLQSGTLLSMRFVAELPCSTASFDTTRHRKSIHSSLPFALRAELAERHQCARMCVHSNVYVATSGVALSNRRHPSSASRFAMSVHRYCAAYRAAHPGPDFAAALGTFDVRMGVASGHLLVGLVGQDYIAFDGWGPAVMLAARLMRVSARTRAPMVLHRPFWALPPIPQMHTEKQRTHTLKCRHARTHTVGKPSCTASGGVFIVRSAFSHFRLSTPRITPPTTPRPLTGGPSRLDSLR